MKKKYITLTAITLVSSILLSGCMGSGQPGPDGKEENFKEKVIRLAKIKMKAAIKEANKKKKPSEMVIEKIVENTCQDTIDKLPVSNFFVKKGAFYGCKSQLNPMAKDYAKSL